MWNVAFSLILNELFDQIIELLALIVFYGIVKWSVHLYIHTSTYTFLYMYIILENISLMIMLFHMYWYSFFICIEHFCESVFVFIASKIFHFLLITYKLDTISNSQILGKHFNVCLISKVANTTKFICFKPIGCLNNPCKVEGMRSLNLLTLVESLVLIADVSFGLKLLEPSLQFSFSLLIVM